MKTTILAVAALLVVGCGGSEDEVRTAPAPLRSCAVDVGGHDGHSTCVRYYAGDALVAHCDGAGNVWACEDERGAPLDPGALWECP